MTTFQSVSEVRPYQIWGGVVARAIQGDRLTMGIVDLDPGIAVPEHHHDNEQLGFVLRGQVTMVIGGDKRDLHTGDTYSIPSGVPHSATSGADGATVVDVFAPGRADWEKLPRLAPSAGRWPA
jgi:quercetin dioxygenase-like cupin family protein